jgi:imidazoleglycerol phosphate dehydratase HisB
MTRSSKIVRETTETNISLSLNIEGEGKYDITTPVPFLTHMLELMTRHGLFDLTVQASGDTDIPKEKVGHFDVELAEEFFQAFVVNSGITLHVDLRRGTNTHHCLEAIFKAFGRAMDIATSIDPRVQGVPSTKGRL